MISPTTNTSRDALLWLIPLAAALCTYVLADAMTLGDRRARAVLAAGAFGGTVAVGPMLLGLLLGVAYVIGHTVAW